MLGGDPGFMRAHIQRSANVVRQRHRCSFGLTTGSLRRPVEARETHSLCPARAAVFVASEQSCATEHEHQRRRADRQDASFPAGAEARDRLLLAVAGAASKRPEARKRKRRSRRKSLMLGDDLQQPRRTCRTRRLLSPERGSRARPVLARSPAKARCRLGRPGVLCSGLLSIDSVCGSVVRVRVRERRSAPA